MVRHHMQGVQRRDLVEDCEPARKRASPPNMLGTTLSCTPPETKVRSGSTPVGSFASVCAAPN